MATERSARQTNRQGGRHSASSSRTQAGSQQQKNAFQAAPQSDVDLLAALAPPASADDFANDAVAASAARLIQSGALDSILAGFVAAPNAAPPQTSANQQTLQSLAGLGIDLSVLRSITAAAVASASASARSRPATAAQPSVDDPHGSAQAGSSFQLQGNHFSMQPNAPQRSAASQTISAADRLLSSSFFWPASNISAQQPTSTASSPLDQILSAGSNTSPEAFKDIIQRLLAINRNLQSKLEDQAQMLYDDEQSTIALQRRVRKMYAPRSTIKTASYRVRKSAPHFVNKNREVPPTDANLWKINPLFPKVDLVYGGLPWRSSEETELKKAILRHNQLRLFDGEADFWDATDDDLLERIDGIDWETIARMVGTRSAIECQIRWTVVQHPFINCDPFTKPELDQLSEIVEKYNGRDWVQIAMEHGHGRVAIQCFKAHRRHIDPPNLGNPWTTEEESVLAKAVSVFGDNRWRIVSSFLDGRSGDQCLHHWRYCVALGKRKGPWTDAEDKQLTDAVNSLGALDWQEIAKRVPTRTDVQCRERYERKLKPGVVRGPFSMAEFDQLERIVDLHGSTNWSLIASYIKGRTAEQCRKSWRTVLRRRSSGVQRIRNPKDSSDAPSDRGSQSTPRIRRPNRIVVPSSPETEPASPHEIGNNSFDLMDDGFENSFEGEIIDTANLVEISDLSQRSQNNSEPVSSDRLLMPPSHFERALVPATRRHSSTTSSSRSTPNASQTRSNSSQKDPFRRLVERKSVTETRMRTPRRRQQQTLPQWAAQYAVHTASATPTMPTTPSIPSIPIAVSEESVAIVIASGIKIV